MSKRTKFIIYGVSFALFFSAAFYAFTIKNLNVFFTSNITKTESTDATGIQKDLTSLSKEDLMKEIKEADDTDIDALSPYVFILLEKRDEFENSEIIDILSDSTYSENKKLLMVELYYYKTMNNVDTSDFKKLLLDKRVEPSIKSRIISGMKFDKSDKKLLEDLLSEDDGNLFFHSLKTLSIIDDKAAYEISKNILSNYNSESKDKVSAALKATSKYLKNNSTKDNDLAAEKESFVNLGNEIINTTSNADIKDAAAFALSDLRSENSISELIKNKSVEDVVKSGSIYDNFSQLKEMLNNPTESDVETVIAAMEILPIMDLSADLEKALTGIANTDLQNRGKKVLEIMRTSGVNVNEKVLVD